MLLVQPSMQPPGGGNGVAAWILQALLTEHRVTVLSWWPVDVVPINRFFGTSLQASAFDRLLVPKTWRLMLDHLPVPAALIRSSLMMRYTRRVVDGFDVVIGVHNETDYGRRGIQYIHYPTYLRPRPDVDIRWYHHYGPVLQRYYRFADWLADFSFERLKTNVTLANSQWTAERIRKLLGIDARVLYPPVVDPAPPVPWGQRERGFVVLGRISPEKEYDRVIRVLARVREQHPDITLTIIGTTDRHVQRYYQELRALAASLGDWIEFRHDLTRHEIRELMARTRYGIHGMREEHFGMAPAEMVRAGMIVWVPRGGGQMEIVGDEPELLYQGEDEAAAKISRVLSDAPEEERLRQYLGARAELFSTDRFVREVQEIVRAFMAESRPVRNA